MYETKSQIDESNSQSNENINIKIEILDKLKDDIDKIIKTYKLLCEDLNGIKNLIEQYNKEKVEKYIENIKNKLNEIIKEDKINVHIMEKYLDDENYNNSRASNSNPIKEVKVNSNDSKFEKSDDENIKSIFLLDKSIIEVKATTTEESTKTKDDVENITKDKFRKNFNAFIRILKFKKNTILKTTDISEFPYLDDYSSDKKLIKFIKDVCELENKNKIAKKNNQIIKDTDIQNICEQIPNLEESDELDSDEVEEVFESYTINGINFEEIKNKLFFFINVISKENMTYNIEDLNAISKKIIECLNLQENNLFLLQNSQIDNFVKCNNFNEIPLRQFRSNSLLIKFSELNTIKMKLLIAKYGINEDSFDNRGNFLNPNSRKIIFRGNEIYEAPYGWMGLGLNVLGKYQDDIWLKDISDKSEWAIAYRGILSKDVNKIKEYLKYFIEKQDLKIASILVKEGIKNKRNSKNINKGVYMTPYIRTAEKYTQSISFNNKKYKVLLMAKVKAKDIIEPEGTNFWILEDKNIRIYRVLFKEIK